MKFSVDDRDLPESSFVAVFSVYAFAIIGLLLVNHHPDAYLTSQV